MHQTKKEVLTAGQNVRKHLMAMLDISGQVSDNAEYVDPLVIFRPFMTWTMRLEVAKADDPVSISERTLNVKVQSLLR